MKVSYTQLVVELTRRCNEKCAHCVRGDAQNVDLSKEVIDAFFEKNNIKTIDTILFSGGEPTLNGEGLLYFVDKLIEKGIVVESFKVVVNGTNYSEEFGEAINKLHRYVKGIKRKYYVARSIIGTIGISQDHFHKPYYPVVLDKLKSLSSSVVITDDSDEHIISLGRAEQNGISGEKYDLQKSLNYDDSYIIYKYGEAGVNFEMQYLCANGNITRDPFLPFAIMDKIAIGNVLEKPLVDMFGIKEENTHKI